MPRVSQEHLDARRQQILDGARRCFVRNGFHATSMQDILKEAGLSAGATYRYFRSKEAIIGAIAEQMVGYVRESFEGAIAANPVPPLDQVFLTIGLTFERLDAEFDVSKMVVQVWSEAVRSPEVHEHIVGIVVPLRRLMTTLVKAYQERGEIGPGKPSEIAKTLVAFWPGFILQKAILGDVDARMFARGLRSLVRAS